MFKARGLLSSKQITRNGSVAAGLLGLSLLLLSFLEYGESGKLSIAPRELISDLRQYDSYLVTPSGTTYNNRGGVDYYWQADRANRLHNGEIDLQNPRYRGVKANQREWTATANQGMLTADGLQLKLHGGVIIAEFLHDTRIKSSTLTLDMSDHSIHSSAPVEFDSLNAITTATGLHANINSERLDLLANVKGVYNSP